MNQETDNSSSTKAKVLVSFMIAIVTFISLAFLAYSSYLELLSGVHELGTPNHKLRTINAIAIHLSKAESDIRSFSLSKDRKHYNRYVEEINAVKDEISNLMNSNWHSWIDSVKLDSVSLLLDKKIEGLEDLLDIKNKTGTSYTEKALNEIDGKVIDSTSLTTISKVRSTKSSKIDTLFIYNPVEDKRQIDGFFNKLKNLFTKNDRPTHDIDTLTRVLSQTSYVYDTNKIVQPDTLILNEVRAILKEVRQRENAQRRQEINKELELLEANSLIIDQVRGIIKNLEEQETHYYKEQKSKASELVKDNLTMIFFIVIIALLGCFLGIILIISDITKSNFLKKRLVKAKARAEKLAQAREHFLANVSHEIRNPLNVVMGYTERLLREVKEKQHKSYATAIHHSSSHLVSLVNDILDISKINAGALHLNHVTFDLNELLNETFETFNGRSIQKGIKMTKNFENVDTSVSGDPVRLKQILFNLLDNAIKFTIRGEIKIEASHKPLMGDMINLNLKVSDTGIGIDTVKQLNIFDHFFQADSSTTKNRSGTGLGLSICKKLVNAMGGNITVTSKPNYGSTFSVNVRLQKSLVEVDGTKANNANDVKTEILPIKVLAIEDDHFNRSLLEIILKSNVELVHTVSNPYDALKNVTEYYYDLIITDIHMPEMDGVELLRQVRQQGINRSTPVIAVTANSTKDRRIWLEGCGFHGIIYKPYSEKNIMEMIKQVTQQENVVSPPPVDKVSSLDFRSLIVFAGDDHQLIIELLEVFHTNALKDVELMNRLFNEGNLQHLKQHIHKMSSPFSQLGAKHIVPIMRSVETRSSLNLTDYHEDVEKITKLIFDVLPEVKDKIRDLEIASLLKGH
ncbi:MAG: ATP-binding protein [Bacteroidota bacterium]